MNTFRIFLFVIAVAVVPSLGAAQDVSAARQELDRGEALLNRGLAEDAMVSFRQALEWALADPTDSAVIAEAYFGIATARGSIADVSVEQARIDEYLQAAQFDRHRYFVAGTNNAAQVARQLGDHATSARLFSTAAREPHPARSYILLDAGREWQHADRPDSALAFFERAVREDPGNTAAIDAFATLALERREYPRVLRLSESIESAAPSSQQIVARTLVEVMADSTTGRIEFDNALSLLAPVLMRIGAGPKSLDPSLRRRLEQVAQRREHRGVRSLLDGYSAPPETTHAPAWWDDSIERLSIWTKTMTNLGMWHGQRGDLQTARGYYECALGYPFVPIVEPWVDIEALVPLARIYVDLPQSDFDGFIRWAFEEKALAYELLRGDAPRAIPITRRLHLTLGWLFARRGQWGESGDDIFGAAYQLAQMREFTQRMQEAGIQVSDPPELLEGLVYAYWAVGLKSQARDLIPEVLAAYSERDRSEDLQRFERVAANEDLLDRIVSGRR